MKVVNYRMHGSPEIRRGVVIGEQVHEAVPDTAGIMGVKAGSSVADVNGIEFLPAVLAPSKIICIGLNYRDHAAEAGLDLPTHPLVFMKYPSALTAHGTTVVIPTFVEKPDWEAELAVVIGRECTSVPASRALDHVAGYTCMNDVSARDVQSSESQWVRAKSFDTFAPLGPWITTADEIPDPQRLTISCTLSGTVVQNSNTEQMVFSVAEIIEFVSRNATLLPGDVIATGTPPGVGVGMKPPRFLADGEEMTVEIESIGRLTNQVSRPAGVRS